MTDIDFDFMPPAEEAFTSNLPPLVQARLCDQLLLLLLRLLETAPWERWPAPERSHLRYQLARLEHDIHLARIILQKEPDAANPSPLSLPTVPTKTQAVSALEKQPAFDPDRPVTAVAAAGAVEAHGRADDEGQSSS